MNSLRISDLIDDINGLHPLALQQDNDCQALASGHASAFAFEVLEKTSDTQLTEH